MSIAKTKKLGFFMALTMLLGSVIGIGIFFKNGSVQRAVDGEGWTWLAAWIIGGVLAAAAAVNFSEMGFFKNSRITGLGNWSHKVGGKLYGYFITFSWGFFYFGILSIILGFFGSEIIVWFLETAFQKSFGLKIGHHILIALTISAVFVGLNYISIKVGGWIQTVTTVLKFIPLVLTILVGIFAYSTHNNVGENQTVSNAFSVSGFSAQKIIVALPAVLFAYDSFLTVASLGKKVNNPTKNIPKIVIFGMLSVIALYTLIAISSILHNQGSVSGVLQDSLSKDLAKGLNIFTLFFLIISTFGVINGFSAGFVAEMEQQRRLELGLGVKFLNKKFSKSHATLILIITSMVFWALVIYLPAAILNTDKVIDGVSNFPTVYFFGLHGVTITLYLLKRFKDPEYVKENRGSVKKGLNNFLIYSTGVLAAFGMIAVTIISFVLLFIGISQGKSNQSWGFLLGNGVEITLVVELLFWLAYLLLLIALPLLNWVVVKALEKRDLVAEFDKIAGSNADDDNL